MGGGTDKVDLNNANVQAYRQFPGMYPTAAGWIATHGPYKQVSDLYEIKGLPENIKDIMKKYEGNFVVCRPTRRTSLTASTTACTAESGLLGDVYLRLSSVLETCAGNIVRALPMQVAGKRKKK